MRAAIGEVKLSDSPVMGEVRVVTRDPLKEGEGKRVLRVHNALKRLYRFEKATHNFPQVLSVTVPSVQVCSESPENLFFRVNPAYVSR